MADTKDTKATKTNGNGANLGFENKLWHEKPESAWRAMHVVERHRLHVPSKDDLAEYLA